MYRTAWARHINYPERHLRPMICYHKRVRYYMAEASGYYHHDTPKDRTDGRKGRVGWFAANEARTVISSSEDQDVLRRMLGWREE
eukprot:13102744-Alexandrium_andersonii.AAC.1